MSTIWSMRKLILCSDWMVMEYEYNMVNEKANTVF